MRLCILAALDDRARCDDRRRQISAPHVCVDEPRGHLGRDDSAVLCREHAHRQQRRANLERLVLEHGNREAQCTVAVSSNEATVGLIEGGVGDVARGVGAHDAGEVITLGYVLTAANGQRTPMMFAPTAVNGRPADQPSAMRASFEQSCPAIIVPSPSMQPVTTAWQPITPVSSTT